MSQRTDLLKRSRDLLRAVHSHINPKAVDRSAVETNPIEECYLNTQARLLADETDAYLAFIANEEVHEDAEKNFRRLVGQRDYWRAKADRQPKGDQLAQIAELTRQRDELLTATTGFRRKLATYVSVYPGDKELRRLLGDCDAAIASVKGAA